MLLLHSVFCTYSISQTAVLSMCVAVRGVGGGQRVSMHHPGIARVPCTLPCSSLLTIIDSNCAILISIVPVAGKVQMWCVKIMHNESDPDGS